MGTFRQSQDKKFNTLSIRIGGSNNNNNETQEKSPKISGETLLENEKNAQRIQHRVLDERLETIFRDFKGT